MRVADVNGRRPFEAVHQTKFDTLVRGLGRSSVINQTQLFGGQNQGKPELTNLAVGGQIASDGTLTVKGIRCNMWFEGIGASNQAFAAFGDLAAITNTLAGNDRANDLYSLVGYGTYFTLQVGTKQMLNAPLWYAPAAGGITGQTTVSDRGNLTNGLATHEALLKLSKDIFIAQRQNFAIIVNFYPLNVLGTGAGGSTITPSSVNPLDYMNQFDGFKLVQFFVDGIERRDIQ